MNTQFGEVTVVSEGHVAVVSFSRPPNNFFDHALIVNLAAAFEAVDTDRELRAIVLASEGKAFCAGASFSGGEGAGDRAEPATLYREANRLFDTRKPIVGAIQGPAIGGGLGLALVPDFRVVAPEARFAANFVKIGIHPGFGLTHTLPRVIGQQEAALLFYTGRRIDGEEALRIGLADILVPAADLRARAVALAAEIAESAPLAVEATRATMRADLAAAIGRQSERESTAQVALFKTADFREGVKAVSERRRGHWVAA
ncbi:MAG: enoyl-CoA hydratase/isomerase family protein [Bradyrhizobium sp.]|nr:enoyl-CoA hydratase/isomerase family protein [Bradyrhizobium sp.]